MKILRLLPTTYLKHRYRMEEELLAVAEVQRMTSLKLPKWPKLTVVHPLMMVTSIIYRSMTLAASAEREHKALEAVMKMV